MHHLLKARRSAIVNLFLENAYKKQNTKPLANISNGGLQSGLQVKKSPKLTNVVKKSFLFVNN